jgi:2-polyprenyl-6-hydroxyphenyl methylase / 3-demethylubiquinone-9 3-methyltransferase
MMPPAFACEKPALPRKKGAYTYSHRPPRGKAAPDGASGVDKSATGETKASTVDRAEIARFAASAESWWDVNGAFRPLHQLNPVRLAFIRDRLAAHFGRDIRATKPFAGLRLLDIGCGGGLVSEPMARLGAAVTGVDAAGEALAVARAHAEGAGLDIAYRQAAAEDLAAAGESFDAVLALEIVEHVADPALFLAAAARLVRPGGAFIASTLNRTPKAFVFGILGAEYLLRWLPRGTHQWRKFLRPSELAAGLRPQGLAVKDIAGLSYSPLTGRWTLSDDLGVNYLLFAVRP